MPRSGYCKRVLNVTISSIIGISSVVIISAKVFLFHFGPWLLKQPETTKRSTGLLNDSWRLLNDGKTCRTTKLGHFDRISILLSLLVYRIEHQLFKFSCVLLLEALSYSQISIDIGSVFHTSLAPDIFIIGHFDLVAW